MGETYGFNMRHYGGEYVDCKTKYGKKNGFDQLNYVIDLIKNDKKFRELIEIGKEYSNEDKLVNFGIVPNSPETGYGYIKAKNKNL